MSRIGKAPVVLPQKVEVTITPGEIQVKGPLGSLAQRIAPEVQVEKVENRIQFKAAGNSRHADAMSGTLRALVANMVTGVTQGFEKRLTLVGVGYRAQAQGDRIGAGVRLGQGEGAECLAGQHGGQPASALLVGPPVQHRVLREDVDAEGDRHGHVRSGDLLHDQRPGAVTEA